MKLPSLVESFAKMVSWIFALGIVPALASAPQAKFRDQQLALLDKMTGRWLLQGTIGKARTTHDIDAKWVLNKEYVQIHEVSREKDAKGKPLYEAIVYLVWVPKESEYACLWLDTTGVTNFAPSGIGHAKPDGDRIMFEFGDRNDGIETTFRYVRDHDSWTWDIDNLEQGKNVNFARLSLSRK